MFERHISVEDVRQVLDFGETVEDYPNDFPYPSRLVLGWSGTRPIHVVTANNQEGHEIVVVTVYEPDPNLWAADFKRRKGR